VSVNELIPTSDSSLTHLFHSCSYDTLYHSRRNDRDREHECDRGANNYSHHEIVLGTVAT